MNRNQLGNTALAKVRPHGLKFRTVRQALKHLDSWVWNCVEPFSYKFAGVKPSDHLLATPTETL